MKHEQAKAITDVASEMYEIATDKGFHNGDVRGTVPANFGAWCANLHSEVSELWEAYRHHELDRQCEKPVQLTCAEEELADIVIRAMDTAHALGISLGNAIAKKSKYNEGRPHKHGKKC